MSDFLDLPYQQQGANWLAANRRAFLADEQGLGKTVQAIMAADMVQPNRYQQRVAVICPAKMKATWEREFETKARLRQRKLRVMSFEEATDVFRAMPQVVKENKHFADVTIIDEAHFLKSPAAQRTKEIYPRLIWSPYVWALSGTPMPNDPSELWTHFFYLKPRVILTGMNGPMSYSEFRDRFCKLAPGYGGRTRVVGAKNEELLRTLNRRLFLRRTMKSVGSQLPPMRYGEILLEDGITSKRNNPELAKADHIVAGMDAEKYRLLIEQPELLPFGDEELSTMRQMLSVAKALPLAKYVDSDIEGHPDQKIVIFSWHTEAIKQLAESLAHYFPVVVTGATPANKVDALVQEFQNSKRRRVFIGQIRAAGTGITLTAANRVIFLDLSWTPADNQQAERRILRIGQVSQSCLCQYAILKGSIDEAVMRVVARKSQMINAAVKGMEV